MRMRKLAADRGGLPPKPGEPSRTPAQRVLELRWQLERFAELIPWDDYVATSVMQGNEPLHWAIMCMRQETHQYDGEDGDELYWVDFVHQERIDPTVDVRR
jgi:hypothetical protein